MVLVFFYGHTYFFGVTLSLSHLLKICSPGSLILIFSSDTLTSQLTSTFSSTLFQLPTLMKYPGFVVINICIPSWSQFPSFYSLIILFPLGSQLPKLRHHKIHSPLNYPHFQYSSPILHPSFSPHLVYTPAPNLRVIPFHSPQLPHPLSLPVVLTWHNPEPS